MQIVTYNVNGLKKRVSQFGSLRKLLDSLDADIVCFQETKLSRQELTTDLAMANGYESFFSCTRTSNKGRVGYSGVATFCRVNSAFSSNEVALPIVAEEGITGLMENRNTKKVEMPTKAEGLEEFEKDELLKLDCEGRCVITDHGHFVVFNVYGPRADCDDMERTEFKISFFKILQKRCESLIRHGRRIFIVGDLNISPSAIDSCRAGPDFENNECRRWLKSVLVECGGPFFDVFRAKHPDRRDAYTCWPQNTGAEEFNYGSRIDHILSTGKCFHQIHDFVTCHVKECDILEKFKRWKPGESPRWKGGRNTKLEGSDHAPVCVCLIDIPSVSEHSTPSLSTRYIPRLHGCQQTIVSLLMKRQGGVGKGDAAGSKEGPSSQNKLLPAMKRTRPNRPLQQSSLRSFFKKNPTPNSSNTSISAETLQRDEAGVSDGGKIEEWRRIWELMQRSIPVCEGHREACASRIVKKAGPNCGRTFYVCARPEGPESNPEANCNYFKWAVASKCSKHW